MIEMNYSDGSFKKPVVLCSGEYEGYNFWILSYGCHPCAYVEVGKDHPFYGKCDCEAYDLPIDVHGGITYGSYGLHEIASKDRFILGWDYNHLYDYSSINHFFADGKRWTTKEMFEDVKSVIQQLKKAKKGWVAMDKDGTWHWFEKKPIHNEKEWDRCFCKIEFLSDNFNIEPFEGDWKDSLRRVK